MARVRSFEKSLQSVLVHPTAVDCEYTLVHTPDGPLLHLSTFGSDHRQSNRKSSQRLQLDQEQAAVLVGIIELSSQGSARSDVVWSA